MRVVSLVFVYVVSVLCVQSKEHPLKASFSKLEVNPSGVVNMETRIFLDDITAHIQEISVQSNVDTVDFSNLTSDGTVYLQKYLVNQFYFESGGQKLELKIVDVSFSKNRLALVVHSSTHEPLDLSKDVFLTNTLLCDANPVQKNYVFHQSDQHLLGLKNPSIKINFD